MKSALPFAFFVLIPLCFGFGQEQPDAALLAEIMKIKAVDNHTHVPRIDLAGENDEEYDALPCGTYVEPTTDNLMTRQDNPEYLAAWKALWHYRWDDRKSEHVKEVVAAKEAMKQKQGDKYPEWVLDQLGIEIMFANRVAMGRGLTPPRFRWVPYDDALIYPLNNSVMAENPDRKFFFSREEMLLRRYLTDLKLSTVPPTLDEYLKQVVTPTLERQKAGGAMAVKFEAAYLRSLDLLRLRKLRPAQLTANISGEPRPRMSVTRSCRISYSITSPPKRDGWGSLSTFTRVQAVADTSS